MRREARQQVLIGLLVAASIAIACFGAVLIANTSSPPTRSGRATHLLALYAAGGPLDEQLAVVRATIDTVDVDLVRRGVRPVGSSLLLDVSDVSVGGSFGQSFLRVRRGRLPENGAEVALSEAVLRATGLPLGGSIDLGQGPRSITGEVEDPTDLQRPLAIVPRGMVEQPTMALLTLRADDGAIVAVRDALRPRLVDVLDVGELRSQRTQEVTTVVALSTVGLFQVGLLCSAGFTVMARRRLRQFGLLAVVGAGAGHVRQVVVLNGVLLGLVGGVVGVVAGFAASLAARPAVESLFGFRFDGWALPWPAVAAFVALATVTAAASAWWPAQVMARVPVTQALRSRRPVAPPRRAAALAALAVCGVGAAGLFWGVRTRQPLTAGIAMLAALCGLLGVAPAVVQIIGRLSARLSLAGRIAGRDLARNQSRSAATLAALVVAFGLPLGVAVAGTSVDARTAEAAPNVPDEVALVWHRLPAGGTDPPPIGFDAADAAAQLAAIRAALPGAQVTPIAMAGVPGAAADEATFDTGEVALLPSVLRASQRNPPGGPQPDGSYAFYRQPVWVATPELLAAWGLDPALAASDAELLGAPSEGLSLGHGPPDEIDDGDRPVASVAGLGLRQYTAVARYWVPPRAVAAAGLEPVVAGWMVRGPRAIDDAERRALGRAAGPELVVETKLATESTAPIRRVAWLGGGAVALGILCISLALLRSEAGEERAVLAAVGAPMGTRRRITAATAGLLVLAAVTLAVPAGYLALVALMANPTAGYGFVVPWRTLALIVLGGPPAASAGAWLLAGWPLSRSSTP